MSKMKAIIIDVSPFVFRFYYGMPNTIKRSDDFPTNAILGFLNYLNDIHKANENFIGFSALEGGNNKRLEIDKNYKANREKPPDELSMQWKIIEKMPELFGFQTLQEYGYEADDMIATSCRLCQENPDISEIEIHTFDKDMYQLLVYDKVRIFTKYHDKPIDSNFIKEKYNVHPHQWIDYLSLIGDRADMSKYSMA